MSRLVIHDAAGNAVLTDTTNVTEIREALAAINVRFERWPVVSLPPEADAEAVLDAYRPHLNELLGQTGAGSADVLMLAPDAPNREALRAKFLNEHTHTEDEVRFFHAGSGNFVLHVDGKVFDAHCTAGDLISVPANVQHWFDAGTAPSFTAVRIFTDTSGWVPHYTDTDMASRFPARTAGMA